MSVSARCYARLHELVLAGMLSPGMRLAELPLATRLGVSRPTVREALQRLEGNGLARSDGRGLYVAGMGEAELVGALEMRAALEGLHAELAAARVRDGHIVPAELRRLVTLAEGAEAATAAGDHAEAVPRNRAFHRAVDALAANPISDEALGLLWDRILVATERSLAPPERAGVVSREHRELIEAVSAGHPQRAARIARDHVRGTLTALPVAGSADHR